jgi:hypothetical protein
MKRLTAILIIAVLVAENAAAETLALYNFDGRCGDKGYQKIKVSKSPPFCGEDYIPDKSRGECGPPLENIGGGGKSPENHRSAFLRTSDGRDVLEMKAKHLRHCDNFRSKKRCLPPSGSFTWEAVIKVANLVGPTTSGGTKTTQLIDNTRYREGGDKSRCHLRLVNLNKEAGTFAVSFLMQENANGKLVEIKSGPVSLKDFHHLAAVFDEKAGTMTLYIDGKLIDSKAIKPVVLRSKYFSIGSLYCQDAPDLIKRVGHGVFTGQIDAVALSDQALKPKAFVLKNK